MTGEPRDFDAFAREVIPGLVRFGRALTGDRGRGEDLAQVALVRLHERWRRLSGADHDPLRYAKRVMVNHETSWRRLASSREIPTDARTAAAEPDLAEHVVEQDALLRLVRALPARQRAVIVLRYYDDLPDRDIADLLGCRESTVRSLAAKGLATLRLTAQTCLTTTESPA